VEDAVPLSEEENRLLEQMERALAAEDPKLASTMRGRTLERAAKMRALGAGVVFLVGIGLLMGGAIAQLTWLAVLGFVVMLASATIGLSAWRGRKAPREAAAPSYDFHAPFTVVDGGKSGRKGRRPRAPKSGTFMQRMEERWHRRRQQGF
jgi:Protein of unknown function (DUF3040)